MTSAAQVHAGHVFMPVGTPKKSALWAGRVISALPVLMMGFSAIMKLTHAPQMVSAWVTRLGWPERLMTPIALIEIACIVFYVIPRTAVLGAIFVSSFLGAAFATHLRVGDAASAMVPLLFGVLAWLGLYLREERLHVLLPIRGMWRESAPLGT